MAEVAFKTVNLTKIFPGTIAVNHVDLELMSGEIHAIVGENGAGKSTFCKMLTGNIQPTEGEMYLFGERVTFSSPADSLANGVCMLYQERDMIPTFTGVENICLGNEPVKHGLIDKVKAHRIAVELQKKFNINLPLETPIGELGAGTQQMIEILRTFYNNPKFIILDEPTASLGEGEIRPFLDFIKSIRTDLGIGIIYITHKLEEVFEIADRITVFTDGVKIFTKLVKDTTMSEVVNAMIRRGEVEKVIVNQRNLSGVKPILEVNDCVYDGRKHKLGFNLHEGEAIGFYGLVGAGRTEAAEVIFGLRRAEKINIKYNGKSVTKTETSKMINEGLILTPEIRANGMFKNETIEDNVTILFLNKNYITKIFSFLKFKKLHEFAIKVLKKHNIKYASVKQNISELSGGNIQKTIIGRSIEIENCKVIILDEPTSGIDVLAKNEIYKKIRHLVEDENKAILYISSELDELITVCDRIYVFSEGDIIGQFTRRDFDKYKILEMAIRRKIS